MFISTARVWHSQQIFIRDFPGKKILTWVFIAAISSQRRKKTPKPWAPTCPGTAQPEQPQAGSWKTPGNQNLVTHLLLQLVMSLIGFWKWWTCSQFSTALEILSSCSESFCPAEWGQPVHLQGGLSALFKKSELTWEWKLLPPTSNTVVKVHCRAGSFSSLL